MLSLLIDGAVPFGYTAEVNDSDLIYTDEYISVAAMNCQNLQNTARQVPLPDVILSNTPPPSPLRRAHSYLTLFPEKSCDQPTSTFPQPDPDAPDTSLEGDTGVLTRSAAAEEFSDGEEKVRTSLEHIEEVRRKLRRDPVQPHHHLPKLSWPLPQLTPSLQHNREEEKSIEEKHAQKERESKEGKSKNIEEEKVHGLVEEGQEQRRWKNVGGDLRKIADQFQHNNSKAGLKIQSEEPVGLAAPLTSTRYLTAFILSLLRLVTTLQQAPLISEDFTVTRISFCTSFVSLWTFVSVFRNLAS